MVTITTKELAVLLGCSDRLIRLYIKDGKIKAKKIGRDWVFSGDVKKVKEKLARDFRLR